jgi:hypothetical protein
LCSACQQAKQRKYVTECAKAAQQTPLNENRLAALTCMKTIGAKNPGLLAEHKQLFERYKHQSTLAAVCQSALDIIAGLRSD